MIALAEGTDLGGSLRIPASFCGVVGLRPSVGLVPTAPNGWAWDTLQVSGPMARTPGDVALMLQAMAGPGSTRRSARRSRGATSRPRRPRASPVVCALPTAPDPAGIGIDADIERICRDAAFGLGDAGAVVEEHGLDLAFVRPAFLAVRGLWFVTQLHALLGQRERFGPNVANNVRAGLETTVEQIAEAERTRGRLWTLCRDLFAGVDCVVTPCMAVPPFPVTESYPQTVAGRPMATYVDWIAPTFVWSMTGLPVAAVPPGSTRAGCRWGCRSSVRRSAKSWCWRWPPRLPVCGPSGCQPTLFRSPPLLDVVVGERRGQLPVGVGLGEQVPGLLLEGRDGVGAGGPAQRRFGLARQLHQRLGELGGVAALQTTHPLPCGHGLPGLLGVVVDRRLGVLRRLFGEQLGAEEAGLHQHGADAERRDLGGERLHPPLDAEFRRGVGRDERLPGNAAGRGDRHDQVRGAGHA